jgi:hypothetical protein
MAATKRPMDAIDYCKRFIKNMPLEQVQIEIMDQVNKIMWMAAPFRWTVGTLSPISLASNTQDYTLAPPADFLYLMNAFISDGTTTPRNLDVEPTLPADVKIIGDPTRISYVGSNTFRVSPKPGTLVAPTQQIISFYKKTSPLLIETNVNTAGSLIFDDEWFWVYCSGVLWMAYLFGDDQRAGGASIDVTNGRYQFTGQRAVFEANMQIMKNRDTLPLWTQLEPQSEDR